MDSDAFIPFAPEDLTAENAKKEERYYEVVDRTIDLICADEKYKTSKKGLKATAYRKGYTRSLFIDELTFTWNYDRELWKRSGSVETPFWIAIRGGDWRIPESFQKVFNALPSVKKEEFWGMTFLALEPLTDATLDEVCEDLRRQILEYIDMFR